MFELIDYARHKMERSVFLYDQKPIYVSRVTNDRRALISPINNQGEIHKISIDDPLLQFEPPTVGYINVGDESYYSYRIPKRRWKQGLSPDFVVIKDRGNLRTIPNRIFFSNEMVDCLTNNYPNLIEAYSTAKRLKSIKAFSKSMAIDFRRVIYSRDIPIGKLRNNRLEVSDVFRELEYILEDSLHENL